MLVFSCLPSRLESRTHFGAYAEWSSGLSGLSVGLLIGRLPSRYTIPQLGRFVCAVVMLPVHAGQGLLAATEELVWLEKIVWGHSDQEDAPITVSLGHRSRSSDEASVR